MKVLCTSFPRRRSIGSFLIYSLSSWLVCVALGLALGSPWLDLGAHLGPFGLPLRPLGTPWGPLGVPRAPLGLPWGSLGVPWGSLWGPLGRLGVNKTIFSDLSKIGRPIPSKCVHFTMPAHKKWPRGTHPRIPRIRPKWRKGRCSQPHFSRRGSG